MPTTTKLSLTSSLSSSSFSSPSSSRKAPCSIPGCDALVHHPASDFCRAHLHQARCFDVVATDPTDARSRHDLVVIAISDDDARRLAYARLAQRARGHWTIASVAEMILQEAG